MTQLGFFLMSSQKKRLVLDHNATLADLFHKTIPKIGDGQSNGDTSM